MKHAFTLTGVLPALAVALVVALGAGTANARAMRMADAIWAGGQLYDTVVTPATFVQPPEHTTDALYLFAINGLGQRLVSDSAPGDPDYNGGRWSVQVVTITPAGIAALDADNDGLIDDEMTSVDDVIAAEAAGYLTINAANIYFECPLLPRRSR